MSSEKTTEKQTQKEQEQATILEQIHKLAEQPRPLLMDEVAAAYVASMRVEDWENLGEEFGGRKIGSIYNYILDLLNERIEESNSMIINAEKPLCEQNPGVINFLSIEFPGGCKCQNQK